MRLVLEDVIYGAKLRIHISLKVEKIWILPAYAYFRSRTLKKIHLKFTLLSVPVQKLFRYNFCCFKVRHIAFITYHASPHCLIKSFTDAKVFVNISRSFASALA